MKKALILGGSGGLSGILAELAEKVYDEVWVLTRGNRKIEGNYRQLTADRNDGRMFEKAVLEAGTNWDVVFDCICMNEEHARQDIEIIGQRTGRLVVISTDSVYASEYKKVLQTEEGVFVGDAPCKIEVPAYAVNKRRMEKVFEEYFREDTEDGLKISIFRPGHMFGPRFLMGCFPMQSRQNELLDIMKTGKISLVGGGCYLIHPVYAEDLARVMLECAENKKTFNEFFCIGGPDIIENKTYYEQLAKLLDVKIEIEEIPLTGFVEKYPEYYGHLCHRAYDLSKLKNTGVALPSTTLKEGLQKQLEYWNKQN